MKIIIENNKWQNTANMFNKTFNVRSFFNPTEKGTKSKRKGSAKPVKRFERGDPSQAKTRAVRATRLR